MEATGTWTSVLYTMAVLDIGAALAAILILKPLRWRLLEADARSVPVRSAPSVALATWCGRLLWHVHLFGAKSSGDHRFLLLTLGYELEP